jgi:TolA-binding protein
MAEAAGGGAAQAQGLRRAGRNEEAAAAYRRYLQRNSGDADAWRGLGLCHIALDRLDDAGYCFWQALKHRPASLPLMMQLGDVLVRTGDMERAATVFEHMTKQHPGEARAYLSLSAVQRELGQEELAAATLKNGVAKNPISIQSSLRAPEARILRLRGVQNAYYNVISGNSNWLRLRGGNFFVERALGSKPLHHHQFPDCRREYIKPWPNSQPPDRRQLDRRRRFGKPVLGRGGALSRGPSGHSSDQRSRASSEQHPRQQL